MTMQSLVMVAPMILCVYVCTLYMYAALITHPNFVLPIIEKNGGAEEEQQTTHRKQY